MLGQSLDFWSLWLSGHGWTRGMVGHFDVLPVQKDRNVQSLDLYSNLIEFAFLMPRKLWPH